MRNSTREEAARIIVAALLKSRLPLSELRRLATLLGKDLDFSHLLAEMLHRVTDPLQHARSISPPSERPSSKMSRALVAIKRRRIPKREIVAMAEQLSPENRQMLRDIPESATVREHVQRILDHLPEKQADRFLAALSGESGDDYLNLILEKG